MKYSQLIGIAAALALCAACFFNWAYYPDLQIHFTGFFSKDNQYGRPGKLLIPLATIAILMFLLNKVWAKRVNWIICALVAAYAFKTYLLFTACYRGICPVKQPAVYVMLISAVIMLAMTFLPKLPGTNTSKPS